MDTPPETTPPPTSAPTQQLPQEERLWAALAHGGALAGFIPFAHIVVPLVIWLVKRESSEFIGDQAKEALNMQISYTIYAFIAGALCFLLIGLLLLPLLGLAWLIFVIVAAISAYDGKRYRYPAIFRLIK